MIVKIIFIEKKAKPLVYLLFILFYLKQLIFYRLNYNIGLNVNNTTIKYGDHSIS